MAKGTHLRITTPTTATARIELDGTDISAKVTGVTVDLEATGVNRASIRYSCVRVEIDGEFRVVHSCPLGDTR